MKVLFVGLGSVGQRHLINLKKVSNQDVEIIAYRKTNHNILIVEGQGKKCESLADFYGIRICENIDKILKESVDVVFVTNPSSHHMEIALKAARCGCHLFIEKPISDSLDGVEDLQREVYDKNLVVMVGCQTRFHPCYKFVRDVLSSNKYGNVISAGFEWGTYLPDHHPYEDYSKSYAAVKSLGGGVVLGLIHEIDIIYSFWGQPKDVVSWGGKLSTLDMNAEDTVSVFMTFKQNSHSFPVSLFLSYAQTKESREFRIQLDRATIFCDFIENKVECFDEQGDCVGQKICTDLDRNDLFVQEVKEFLSAIKGNRKPLVSLEDGVEGLKLALRIKEGTGDGGIGQILAEK